MTLSVIFGIRKRIFFSYGGYITLNIAIIDDVQQDLFDTLGRAAQNYYEDRQIMVQIQTFFFPCCLLEGLHSRQI